MKAYLKKLEDEAQTTIDTLNYITLRRKYNMEELGNIFIKFEFNPKNFDQSHYEESSSSQMSDSLGSREFKMEEVDEEESKRENTLEFMILQAAGSPVH